jgi:hypothetical protein
LIGFGHSTESNANCANSSAALQNGIESHNVGEYWYDGEDTAYLISSWHDPDVSMDIQEDDDFYMEVSGGGGGTCEGPNCGGNGENPGLNAANSKKRSGIGEVIESCITLPTVAVTANRISGRTVGNIRLYIRRGQSGSGRALTGAAMKKKRVTINEGTCQTLQEERTGYVGNNAWRAGVTQSTRRTTVLEVTWRDGNVELWRWKGDMTTAWTPLAGSPCPATVPGA